MEAGGFVEKARATRGFKALTPSPSADRIGSGELETPDPDPDSNGAVEFPNCAHSSLAFAAKLVSGRAAKANQGEKIGWLGLLQESRLLIQRWSTQGSNLRSWAGVSVSSVLS